MSESPRRSARASATSRQQTNLVQRLALIVGGLITGLLVAEIGLRLVVDDVVGYYIWKPGLHVVFHPREEFIPGVEGETHFRVNSLGLRGEELTPDHDYRVLAVGGSSTECNYLDQEDAWPLRLASDLNRHQGRHHVWVGIVAKSGLNARHNMVQLEELLPRLPPIDLVIVLAGINDLTLRLSQEDDYDPDYVARDGARTELIARSFQLFPAQPGSPLIQRTALWSLKSSLQVRLPSRKLEMDDGGQIYDVWREHRRSASAIRDTLPDLRSALAEFRRHLAAQVDLSRAHGAQVLLVTQPTLWRSDLPAELEARLWFGGTGDFQRVPGREYYSVEALERGMQAFNSAMIDEARDKGVESFDLAAKLPKEGSVFYDDVHFTTDGSRQAAQLLADYLMTRAPFVEP